MINPSSSALAGALNSFLAGFGVRQASEHDQVAAALSEELSTVGLEAEMTELRYGRLVLTCDLASLPFVRAHSDRILTAVERAVPGAVTTVTVRPAKR